MNKPIKAISKESMLRLMNYSWPGNIRELENIIERAVITSRNSILNIEPLPKSGNNTVENLSLEEIEKNHILNVLRITNWKINGKDGSAEMLKINPQTLRSKMLKLGIKRNKND